jgi:hypothetical protein
LPPDAEGATPQPAAGPAVVKLHMPEPPRGPSPATMRRIQGVQSRAGGHAAAHAALPDASAQVGDARQAVTPPSAEADAAAKAALIAQVQAAPSPEIVKLCERIREVIASKRPPDEDALMEAKPEGAALDAGNQLNATVQTETKKVQDNYGTIDKPAAAPPQAQAPGVPPQPPPAVAAPINATAATPDAVPASNVSLEQDAAESKKKAAGAGMDKPAAQLVQSGPIAEARAAQGELDQVAREDPAKVLANQKQTLAKAEGDMAALQSQALAALTASREGAVKGVGTEQRGMVGSEEQQRAKAGAEAQKVFNGAKTAVEGLLQNLASNAMAEWDAAKEVLATQFKADLAIVQRRVDERHSGASGFVVGLWDAVTGLPDWAEEAYTRAETKFGDGVIAKLTSISTNVNAVIAACDIIIKGAREEIAKIFADLPQSLQAWAAQEQAKFEGQLDALHNKAIAARDSFNKDLIERSSAAVDEVRSEIAELRKKAGGLVGRIANAIQRFVDDPVKFIIEGLLELLGIPPAAFWAVVAKIKKVVKDIADDPLGFANNLLEGLSQGFSKFFDNFGGHLIKGFLGWLLGDLKDVQVPKDVSLKSIVTFFLQLMGITWPNIRKILANQIGEKNVALIEKVYSLVSLLIEQGPAGIYEMIKERLDPQAIVDQVIQLAVDYMVTAIAKQVAVRLLALFNPAGAIVQALEAIYRVLKWVFQNAAKIFSLVETVVNGIADIIAGNLGGFAAAVEKGLAMLIGPVIGFVADYFSLGDLPQVVAKQIKAMREWILGKIEKAFVWIIEKGKALLAAVGIGKKDKKDQDGAAAGVGEEVSFEAGGEAHRVWIDVKGKNATVMVASEPQGVKEFLASQRVRAVMKGNAKLSGLVAKAESALKTVDMSADQLVNELSNVGEQKAQGGNTDAKSNKVKTLERQLAEYLHDILDILASKPEPFAGLHGYLKQVSSKDLQDSHHVPAKALGSGMADFLEDVAKTLRKNPWRENKLALKFAGELMDRAKVDRTLATPPGDKLSAISLSHDTHKGDAGIHSTSSAELIAKLATDPSADAIIATRRKTESKIAQASYISVNPQIAGWRAFLADVRRRLDNPAFRSDPNKARDEKQAVSLILDQAKEEFEAGEELTTLFLQDRVVIKVNEIIDEAPQYAYDAGRAIVANAMEKTGEGSEKGRAAALSDLDSSFESSWLPFRQVIES